MIIFFIKNNRLCNLFDNIIKELMILMRDSFSRFIKTEAYKTIEQTFECQV